MSNTFAQQIQMMQEKADELLKTGNLPQSYGNIEALTAMEYYEGGIGQTQSGGATNPWDVVNGPNGQINPFQDMATGLQKTLDTIESNDPKFYSALQQTKGSDPAPDISALSVSQWAGLNPQAAAANRQYAGNVASVLTNVYGDQSNMSVMLPNTIGGNTTVPKTGLDILTQSMVQLNSVLNAGGVFPLKAILARGALALGFAGLGVIGILSIASDSFGGIKGVPGIVAGFMGGREAGVYNLKNRLGVRTAPDTSLAEGRLTLAQQKESRVSAENERRRIENATKEAAESQRINLAGYRARTQRRAVKLKERQFNTFQDAAAVANPAED